MESSRARKPSDVAKAVMRLFNVLSVPGVPQPARFVFSFVSLGDQCKERAHSPGRWVCAIARHPWRGETRQGATETS
ncbi:hypothetical protein HC62_00565 [Acetobacter tropicalis]|uniref:Uncharacterized protein n=1 Tax=Acetobacter tropicalis TaxID=104102 RepID=A0A252AC78_9PROT|nr:hypothetical protein HC62_00565 [Acetobacter tropicalis]